MPYTLLSLRFLEIAMPAWFSLKANLNSLTLSTLAYLGQNDNLCSHFSGYVKHSNTLVLMS